jgi:proliferating cell nuclear antigen
MIMNAKIRKQYLKQIVECASSMVDECKISASNDGLNIKIVDPANVCMICVDVPKSVFDQYQVTLDQMIKSSFIPTESYEVGDNAFGIDLNRFKAILKKGRDDDLITIEVDTTTNDIGVGYPVDKKGTNGIVTFKLVDTTGMSDPKVPKLTLPNNYTMDIDSFQAAVIAVGEYSDHLALTGNGELTLSAENADAVKFHVTWIKEQLVRAEGHDTARSLFPLDYMISILKGIKSFELITLHIGNDLPIELTVDDSKIGIRVLLAPRIEND